MRPLRTKSQACARHQGGVRGSTVVVAGHGGLQVSPPHPFFRSGVRVLRIGEKFDDFFLQLGFRVFRILGNFLGLVLN